MTRSRKIRRAALIAGVALATALFAAELHRRQGLYWYPVDQDYAYNFDPRQAAVLPVRIERNTVRLPEHEGRWGTTFLRLQLSSRLTGWWFEPCIEVLGGGSSSKQCFERGARGTRYVLLPGTGRSSPPREIELRGHHLDWGDHDAAIMLLEAPELSGKRVLVLAPHPDDAEIAAFGLYSTHESYVVTMTAGGYVDGLYDDAALRSDVRTWDSLAVPLWGGVPAGRTVNLGYLTNSLQEFHAAALASAKPARPASAVGRYRKGAVAALLGGRPAEANWSSVVADLAAVLSAVRPDFVVAPHPALDSAPDHQYTTAALLEALEQLNDTCTTLLLYTNHHVHAEHYPFGPSDSTVTLPPWFGGAPFAGVYSHPLDSQAQVSKLFALEAMHDLRAPPERVTTGPAGVLAQRLRQATQLVLRDPVGDYSYFRRAVRPNEIFFVYGPADRGAVADYVNQHLNR